MNFEALLPAVEVGLIYGIVAIAVYLTYKVLDFPDLTVDGTFPLGACITAVAMTAHCHPIGALVLATLSGMLAGAFTAYLSLKLRIASLLASILVMTALYSVNLRIMGGPNRTIVGFDNIFSLFSDLTGLDPQVATVLLLTLIIAVLAAALLWFFLTEVGLFIRATGANPDVVASFGGSVSFATIFAVALSNGLVALAGGLFAQYQSVADVGFGVGTIIYGLIAVITGTLLTGGYTAARGLALALGGAVIGSVCFRFLIGQVVAMDALIMGIRIDASDLNLITSLLVIGLLAFGRLRPLVRMRT